MNSNGDKRGTALRAELVALVSSARMEGEERRLCVELLGTLTEPRFPGALAPAMDKTGARQIDVVAQTRGDWRRLRPILQAFAGPTLTGFTGLPQAFGTDDAVGLRLLRLQPSVTSVIPLSPEPKLRIAALRALRQAVNTVVRAPKTHREAPAPTSWLLAQFQDHLNIGRRDAAATVLQRLRAEMRLDGA